MSDPDPRKRQPASIETPVEPQKAREAERGIESVPGPSRGDERQGDAALADVGKQRGGAD